MSIYSIVNRKLFVVGGILDGSWQHNKCYIKLSICENYTVPWVNKYIKTENVKSYKRIVMLPPKIRTVNKTAVWQIYIYIYKSISKDELNSLWDYVSVLMPYSSVVCFKTVS